MLKKADELVLGKVLVANTAPNNFKVSAVQLQQDHCISVTSMQDDSIDFSTSLSDRLGNEFDRFRRHRRRVQIELLSIGGRAAF
jgi:hypothetical protein